LVKPGVVSRLIFTLYLLTYQNKIIMPGPGYYLFGEEEKKEVLDVLESGYVSRYGDLNDPDFKHKVFTLEQEFPQGYAKCICRDHLADIPCGPSYFHCD
jgi:hypothetical protein